MDELRSARSGGPDLRPCQTRGRSYAPAVTEIKASTLGGSRRFFLRHCLLPHPGGFEGFAPSPEDLYALNPRAAEAVDVEGLALDRGAARSATSVDAVTGQDPRVGVEKFKQVRPLVIERLLCGHEVSLNLLDPAMNRRTGKLALIVPFDIWIEELGREIRYSGSPVVPECEKPTDKLHVLLRNNRSPCPLRHGFQRNALPEALELADQVPC
jgi:hypothetical protein